MIYLCLEKEWKSNKHDLDSIFSVFTQICIVLSQKKHALRRALDVTFKHWRSKAANKLVIQINKAFFLSLSKTNCSDFSITQQCSSDFIVLTAHVKLCRCMNIFMSNWDVISEKELSWEEVLSWLFWAVQVCWTRWKALYFWYVVGILLIFITAMWQLLPQCTTHQSKMWVHPPLQGEKFYF